MFIKILYTIHRTCICCELVKKTLVQIKLTNKPSEIKETEYEQSE